MAPKCPGQDQRYWTPDDIFDVGCPYCGRAIEFWKDEPFRLCRDCGREVRNPRLDLTCADWCASADECLGRRLERGAVASPVVERLMALLEQRFADAPERLRRAREVCARVDTLLKTGEADPKIAKPAGMLTGAAIDARRQEGADREDPVEMRRLLCGAGIAEPDAIAIERVVLAVTENGQAADPEVAVVRQAVEGLLR